MSMNWAQVQLNLGSATSTSFANEAAVAAMPDGAEPSRGCKSSAMDQIRTQRASHQAQLDAILQVEPFSVVRRAWDQLCSSDLVAVSPVPSIGAVSSALAATAYPSADRSADSPHDDDEGDDNDNADTARSGQSTTPNKRRKS